MKGRLLAVGALLFALFGCSSAPNGELAGNLPDADPSALQRRPQPQGATAQASLASAGLTQAPTAQQVIESFPEGRLDPFGPIPAPVAAAPAQAPTPAKIREMLGNFAVLGFIKASGQQAVFVQHESKSGEVYLDQVGGQSTEFLPRGWRLVAIEASKGRIGLTRADLKEPVFIKI